MVKYISLDTETTGLDPNTSELLEVGLVIFDSEVPFVQTSENSLRIVLVKENIKGNLFAINMNINLLKEMLRVIPDFNDNENKSIIEDVQPNLTTWYVDLRPKNILDSLYQYEDHENLDTLKYKLVEFLSKAKVDGKLNIAGKNFANFDKGFLSKYNCFKTSILNRMRHRVLDVGSMFVTSEDSCIPDLNTCLKRAGINEEVPHCAVDDARLVALCAQYKFNVDNKSFLHH